MAQFIPLSRGKIALCDDADYPHLSQYRWHTTATGYAATHLTIDGHRRTITMHRFLLAPLPDQWVDHINGCKLDNRRENLRLVNAAQNKWNSRAEANSRCPYKGVGYHRGNRAWVARIQYHGRRYTLGYFSTPETAALAYNLAAEVLFAEYAWLNPVGGRLSQQDEDQVQKIIGRANATGYAANSS